MAPVSAFFLNDFILNVFYPRICELTFIVNQFGLWLTLSRGCGGWVLRMESGTSFITGGFEKCLLSNKGHMLGKNTTHDVISEEESCSVLGHSPQRQGPWPPASQGPGQT